MECLYVSFNITQTCLIFTHSYVQTFSIKQQFVESFNILFTLKSNFNLSLKFENYSIILLKAQWKSELTEIQFKHNKICVDSFEFFWINVNSNIFCILLYSNPLTFWWILFLKQRMRYYKFNRKILKWFEKIIYFKCTFKLLFIHTQQGFNWIEWEGEREREREN